MNMSSIRGHLTKTLCLLAAVILPLAGLAVYLTARASLVSQFDALLMAKASALAAASEEDDDEFEIDREIVEFAGFSSSQAVNYFIIYTPDGRIVARSPSFGRLSFKEPLPHFYQAPTFTFLELSDGRHVRALSQLFNPQEGRSGYKMIIAATSGTLEKTLKTLGMVLVIVALCGLGVALGVMHITLKRGFRPLDQLAGQVQNLKIGQPDQQLDTAALPQELHGIGEKLNELMDRVEASLARERRFSSHAAHELRTPLAELRSMLELIHDWPDEKTPEHSAEMIEVISEMEALLEKLSMLAKSDARAHAATFTTVQVKALVESVLARHDQNAIAKDISLNTSINVGVLHTDEVFYAAILNNLIGNAVSHAPRHTLVNIEVSEKKIRTSNQAPNLQQDDLPKLFERFWRKSSSRGVEVHSGLGLSIVQACAQMLGAECHASLNKDQVLTLEVHWS